MSRTTPHPILRPNAILVVSLFPAWLTAGCSANDSPPLDGSSPDAMNNGSSSGSGSGSSSGSSSGGSSGGSSSSGSSSGTPMQDATAPDDSGTTPDATTGTPDSGTSGAECPPPGGDGGAWPSDPIGDGGGIYHYSAEYPIYYPCTPTPPVVTMGPTCSDPTLGYTEYRDTFHVEWGINVPNLSNRFDLVGGIYNFMVGSGDGKHSQSANGTTPRTEAAFGAWHDALHLPLGTANNTGIGTWNSSSPDPDRIYSADWYLDSSADGTVVFQLHTIGASGVGPVYMTFTKGGLDNPSGSNANVGKTVVPATQLGGTTLANQWFNIKVQFNAASGSGANIYINNCRVPAGQNINSNNSGDTNYYFKNGLYKCTTVSAPLNQGPTGVGGCNRQVKNIHLYSK